MAAATDVPGPLKYQTWTLRVPIHCEGCKKKVKKILQKLDGVYMTTIDAQQHKVTVTGSIDAQTLLHKLAKSGKPAELWADNSVKNENMLEAPSSTKEKTKPTKESDGKNKNQKAPGKATEEGGQKKETKSADNHADPAKTVKGSEVSDKAPPLDGDKPLQLENAGGTDGVDGTSNGSSSDKKKKKKSKGNNGNAGNDEKSKPPASTPPVSVPEAAPVLPETPAPAPTSVPTESPIIPAELPQNYMYPPAHYPQPQLGMSYSMAQPSSSTSFYAPPYYAYEYPQYHTMHIPPPPPPSNPINEFYHDDQYYNDNADESRCSLM
uniref:HMA domain-containing protein n=1 Tax=Chenopodium quinoa TaxID=63459 RepID=A0A803L9S2_CHEQI